MPRYFIRQIINNFNFVNFEGQSQKSINMEPLLITGIFAGCVVFAISKLSKEKEQQQNWKTILQKYQSLWGFSEDNLPTSTSFPSKQEFRIMVKIGEIPV